MAGVQFSTKVSGPFFELKGQPLKDAGADTIQDLLKEGAAKAQSVLVAGKGLRTGDYRSSITHKFIRSSEQAIGWGKVVGDQTYPNGVKGKWLEGGTKRNQATRFKGYAMFRKATQHVRKLARQMAGKHYARAVQRLT